MSLCDAVLSTETGNDNKLETLSGFAWSLRLRALMEQASNLAEALQFWRDTNNTLGINHGIGSAADNQFVALETKAGYTAYFHANDPRESGLVINGTQYGFPMPVCVAVVWRNRFCVGLHSPMTRLLFPWPA